MMHEFCRSTLQNFTIFPNSPSASNRIWTLTTAQSIQGRPEQLHPWPRRPRRSVSRCSDRTLTRLHDGGALVNSYVGWDAFPEWSYGENPPFKHRRGQQTPVVIQYLFLNCNISQLVLGPGSLVTKVPVYRFLQIA